MNEQLTRTEQFACAAVTGILASNFPGNNNPVEVVRLAFEIAQIMDQKARQLQPVEPGTIVERE